MIYAVVVARAGNGAKSRLAPVLSQAERLDLVIAMARDVVDRCAATALVDGTIVVADALVAAHLSNVADVPVAADLSNVAIVPDPGEMNAAAAAGIAAACQRGATTAIVLPADIPLITDADLHRLISAAPGARTVVVGASRDGHGTNALLLRPPDAIAPSFGPPSLERHLTAARAANCETTVLRDLDLALDIDTPEDLAILREHPDLPPHTRALLSSS